MRNIKNEKLFVFFSSQKTESTSIGRDQFIDHQSYGVVPINPDDYYKCLDRGKYWFDFLCSEYHELYCSGYWWGFTMLWNDWKGDRWILPYLCKWHKGELPKWLVDENITEKEIDKMMLKNWSQKCMKD